jgi:hypothetical protein
MITLVNTNDLQTDKKRAVGGVISESCFTNQPTLLNPQKRRLTLIDTKN